MARHPRLHAVLVLCGGLAFTTLVVWMLAAAATQRDRQTFEANARAAQDVVTDRIETSIALLRGTAGLFASREQDPTLEEFRSYMNRLALRELYPGILGIGYSRRVLAQERDTLERALTLQGYSSFRVWPAHPRDEWHSIVYLEPLDERNLAALGYDMFTHPVRRAAMERARDSGIASASAIVELVQEIDAEKQPGFLIYLPVYSAGTAPATVEERRERLRGFAYAPIRGGDFLSSAFSHETRPSVGLRVSQETAPGQFAVLYQRDAGAERQDALYTLTTRADVGGQAWHFEFWSFDTLAQALVVPILIGVAGAGISIALATLLWREELARKAIHAALEREQAARSQAEHANRMKDDFLATLSHELRTPLNAIVGWGAVLATGRLSSAETRNAIEAIERNARTQARLIEDLLDTNRIVSGKLSMELQPLDFRAVVDAALDAVLPEALRKRIDVERHLPEQHLAVRGDFGRLQQIVWNLLSNAIKFTADGGRIDIAIGVVGERVRLSVSDNGEGIEQQFLPHIFDRFSQADGRITRRHGGLGLGLAIVRELVALHGGEVLASSAGRGQGATFLVELPLLCAEAASDEARAPWEQTLEGVKVLVVDDEPEVRRLLRLVLEQRHAEVHCSASAEEALAALEPFRPDVLVSDIGMADVDGYELMRRIGTRARQGLRTPRAVALSAYTRESDRQEALRAGFEVYLVKPVQPERLVATVTVLAGRSNELLARLARIA